MKRQTIFLLITIYLISVIGSIPTQSVRAATLVVTNANPSGIGSLRQTILDAMSGDTITFAPELSGANVYMLTGMTISKDITIDATILDSPITLDGQGGNRLFQINTGYNVTLKGLIIKNGYYNGSGGTIYNEGNLTISKCSILNSTANSFGGAIFNTGTLNITDCTFSGNSSIQASGGSIAIWSGVLNVHNSSFFSNHADEGGAIRIFNGQATFINTTFYGNAPSAIHSTGKLILRNSTVGQGGGFGVLTYGNYITGSNTSELHIFNSILADNVNGQNCYNNGAQVLTNINNLIESGNCGTPLLSSDPLLVAPADNGGFTKTMALLSGSPAINAGDDETCEGTDQRGVSRPQGSVCDIGAYEYEYQPSLIVTNTNNNGFGSLRQVLADASNGDTITFDSSLSGQTIRLQSTLAIDKNITIDASALSEKIILNGDSDNDNDGDILILNILANQTVVIKNLEFTKGYTPNTTNAGAIANLGDLSVYDSEFHFNSGGQGGAIRNSGDLYVENSIFTNNTGVEGGAILNSINADIEIRNSTFSNNTAIAFDDLSGAGGATANVGTMSIYDSDFTNNNSTGGGGAIINSFEGTLIISGSAFTGNSASEYGGGAVNNFEGTLEIYQSTFSNNSAYSGGAISTGKVGEEYYTTTIISESVITNNEATFLGGGIDFASGVSMTIDKTTISQNTAEAGGGINNITYGGLLLVTNSLISNNISTEPQAPGGIFSFLSPLTIKNSTITGNSNAGIGQQGITIINNSTIAENEGNGLEIYNYSLSLTNSILANNGNFDCRTQNGATVTTNQNNLIETNSGCGTPASTADPLLGPLADNGGFTQTMFLYGNSPAINAGDNATCESTDQRGVARPYGSQCDIGAYEVDKTPIEVTIGTTAIGTYFLGPSESQRVNYAGVDSGPVVVEAIDGTDIIAALRDAYFVGGQLESFVQLMGLPQESLSTTYYFPAYNNVTLDGQLRFGNVGNSATTVTVTIAGVVRGTYPLNPGEAKRVNYTGLDSGPVVVSSSGGVPIIAALRDAYYVDGRLESFAQLMGLPAENLSTKYYFPAYNNVTLDGQLRVGNVGNSATTVTVTIAGVVRGTYPLNPSQAVRINYAGLDAGPVVVESSGGIPIIAALRDAYFVSGKLVSFVQLMGLPQQQLSTNYNFPAYNNVTLDGQLSFGNVGDDPTTVTVTIAGVVRGTYPLNPSEAKRVNYAGLDAGPVVISSSGAVPIIAALRDAYFVNGKIESFAQLMGLPQELLFSAYFFPAYNNVTLDGQLRFGVP